MSNSTPNPLMTDPSIIQVNSQSMKDNRSHNNDDNNINEGTSLEASNALSKLLDSAMLNAAKESSPEYEIKSSSNTNSNSTSPRSSKSFKNALQPIKKSYEFVYTIETLLSMKNLSDNDIVNDLPPKEFWCLYKKQPNFQKDFNNNNNSNTKSRRERHPNKRDFESKKKKAEIDELLDDNTQPEWNSEFTDNLKLEMGDTVEDFEKWKQAQRKKNDGVVDQRSMASTGNDVDSFFSFSKIPNSEGTDKKSTDAKSSRFSSFFTPPQPPTHGQPPVQEQIPTAQHSNPSQQQIPTSSRPPASHSTLPRSEIPDKTDKSSRFFSVSSDKSSAASTPSAPPAPLANDPRHSPVQTQQPQLHPMMQGPQGPPPPGFPIHNQFPPNAHVPMMPGIPFPYGQPGEKPQANDTFFMSLLGKRPESGQVSQSNHPDQSNPNRPNRSPLNQNLPPWLNQIPPGQFPPGFPQPGQVSSNLPPGVQNNNNNNNNINNNSNNNNSDNTNSNNKGDINDKESNALPLHSQLPPGFPPFNPQQPPAQGNDRNQSRAPNNLPFGFPPPPPGMFPQGMPFPPGMVPPPQFRGDPNLPIPQNQQFMPFPPGMMPNRPQQGNPIQAQQQPNKQ